MKTTIRALDVVYQQSYSVDMSFFKRSLMVNNKECTIDCRDFWLRDANRSLIESDAFMKGVKAFDQNLYHILRLKHFAKPAFMFASPLTGTSEWVMNMMWDLLLDQDISHSLKDVSQKYLITPILYKNEYIHVDMYGNYLGVYEITNSHADDFIHFSNQCRRFTVLHHDTIKSTPLYISCMQALMNGENFDDVVGFYNSFIHITEDVVYKKVSLDHDFELNL